MHFFCHHKNERTFILILNAEAANCQVIKFLLWHPSKRTSKSICGSISPSACSTEGFFGFRNRLRLICSHHPPLRQPSHQFRTAHRFGAGHPQRLLAIAPIAGCRLDIARKRYKPLVLWMTIHERVPYLGLAIIALYVPFTTKQTALMLIFLMLIWQGLGSGLVANPWINMVTKVIPQELHGTFFGTQSAAYNGMGGLSAIIAGLILDKMAMPYNYSLCFALTFASLCISYIFASMTREPDSLPKEGNHPNAFLKKSLEILKRDKNFQIFLGIRMLSQFAGNGFCVLCHLRRAAIWNERCLGRDHGRHFADRPGYLQPINGTLGRPMEYTWHDEPRAR